MRHSPVRRRRARDLGTWRTFHDLRRTVLAMNAVILNISHANLSRLWQRISLSDGSQVKKSKKLRANESMEAKEPDFSAYER
jgi:hypothetical protein